jgi:hypothetical protein
VLAFFFAFFFEIGGDTWKAYIVSVEEGVYGMVDVADIVFNVNLLVDSGFALGVEVGAGVRDIDWSFVNDCQL